MAFLRRFIFVISALFLGLMGDADALGGPRDHSPNNRTYTIQPSFVAALRHVSLLHLGGLSFKLWGLLAVMLSHATFADAHSTTHRCERRTPDGLSGAPAFVPLCAPLAISDNFGTNFPSHRIAP